jgi:predicted phosphodiesterase
MVEYKARSYSVGFIGDSHNKNENINSILDAHPEITEWFFLGDMVSFLPAYCGENVLSEKWFKENQKRFIGYVKGNHDHVVGRVDNSCPII